MPQSDASIAGFPLSEDLEGSATKSDLFFIASHLFRICGAQQVALRAIKNGDNEKFEEIIKTADEDLDDLYALLQPKED